MKIAFYKGEGGWTDKLIRLWTGGIYSHCEIIYEDEWYSSSWYDGGVRRKKITLKPENWDIYNIKTYINEQDFLEFFERTNHKKYDLKGIFLSQIIPLKSQDSDKYFCSEWCSIIFKLNNTAINPNKLSEELKKLKYIGEKPC